MKNVLTLPYEPKLTEHETEKRTAMFASFIRASSNPGELGLVPFAGSGSTAAVARRSSGDGPASLTQARANMQVVCAGLEVW